MAAMAKQVCMVTGGTGLYGSAIKTYVEQTASEQGATWVFLSSKDGDLRDRAQTEAIFERVKPTHVVHLAAMVGGLFANMAKKVEFYRENMPMNDNVMECCRIYEVEKLVACLSTCIFNPQQQATRAAEVRLLARARPRRHSETCDGGRLGVGGAYPGP